MFEPDVDDAELDPLSASVVALDRLLIDAGPLPRDEIISTLLQRGLDLDGLPAETVVGDAFDVSGAVHVLADGRWCHVRTLVAGRVLTRHVTDEEARTDRLVDDVDLGWLTSVCFDELDLADGRTAKYESDGSNGCFVGPRGWLDHVAGTTAVIALSPGPRVAIEPVGAVTEAASADTAIALRRAFDDTRGRSVDVEIYSVVYAVMAADPDAFTTDLEPLSSLVSRAGLELRGVWVGEAGTDWMIPGERWDVERAELLDELGFDDCCRAALEEVESAWRGSESGRADRAQVNPSVAVALGHGAVADVFCRLHFEKYGPIGVMTGLAEQFLVAASTGAGRHAAGPLHLLATVYARSDDPLTSERWLRAALAADPDHLASAFDLAWCALDRGDVAEASRMMGRCGMDSKDRFLQLVESAVTPRESFAASRNDACPCGSGRKYKVCHARPVPLSARPLRERTALLTIKVSSFLHRTEPLAGHAALAEKAARAGSGSSVRDDLPAHLVEGWLEDPFIDEVFLWEGGAVIEFLAQREDLLPDDEVDALESWLGVRRELWEVVHIESDVGLTLRNACTGDEVVLVDRPAVRLSRPGTLLMARVVPVDGVHQLFGLPLEVSPAARESALSLIGSDPDAEGVVTWYARQPRPRRSHTFPRSRGEVGAPAVRR